MNEDLLPVLNYLLLLPEETRTLVLRRMQEKLSGGEAVIAAAGCPSPKPSDSPTPYGSYECHGGQWVWVAEVGNQS